MGLIREFRDFAVKGNVIDLAVGVIIGGAFGKIVSSLVEDVVMPPISLLTGQVDLSKLDKELRPAVGNQPALVLKYGAFLNAAVQFVILAFVIFLMVKAINRAKKLVEQPTPEGQPVVKQCPYCLSEIPIHATKCKFCTSEVALA